MPELTPEEERTLIRDISAAAEAQTREGDTFYIITSRFYLNHFCFGPKRFVRHKSSLL